MRILLIIAISIAFTATSCSEGDRERVEQDSSEATVASETGTELPLPEDVLFATKPLINGELYTNPDFKSPSIASFDTAQQIHVLDVSHAIFARARIRKDTALLVGYVPKTILPERR